MTTRVFRVVSRIIHTGRSFETSGIINVAARRKKQKHINPVSDLLNSSLSNAQHMQRRNERLLVND